jgi:hypothetical protein
MYCEVPYGRLEAEEGEKEKGNEKAGDVMKT